MFVTLEGIDGAGKSTQARMLAEALGPQTVLLREPGGTPAGEALRGLLKDRSLGLEPRTELLLFCAARAELVERVIGPALAAGRDIVCDRFTDSTLAYQGHARGLGPGLVERANEIAVASRMPERTVLLRIDPERAAERAGERRGEAAADRFEAEGLPFQRQIAAAFELIAATDRERIVVVDADGPADAVHARVLEAVRR